MQHYASLKYIGSISYAGEANPKIAFHLVFFKWAVGGKPPFQFMSTFSWSEHAGNIRVFMLKSKCEVMQELILERAFPLLEKGFDKIFARRERHIQERTSYL